jgi:hypothetical protein
LATAGILTVPQLHPVERYEFIKFNILDLLIPLTTSLVGVTEFSSDLLQAFTRIIKMIKQRIREFFDI